MISRTEKLLDTLSSPAADPRVTGKLHSQRTHDDYSTPPHYATLVKQAFGGVIACDPASTDVDNIHSIRAEVFYTIEHSGLNRARPWISPVYLNPPSAQRDKFLHRAAGEAAKGCEMVVCLNLKHLCAGYAQPLLQWVTAVHMPAGRPAFLHAETRDRSERPTDGRVFLYCGPTPNRFVDVFKQDSGWTYLCIWQKSAQQPRPQAMIVED